MIKLPRRIFVWSKQARPVLMRIRLSTMRRSPTKSPRRFESATQTYERIWQQYPKSSFAGEALWRSAINHQKYFAFDKAVQNYLILADSARFKDSSHRADAIFNAAVILEQDQSYGRAAELFERYARLVKDDDAAAEAFLRAGLVRQKDGDHQHAQRLYAEFPRRFGSQPTQAARVIEAYYRLGDLAEEGRDFSRAKRAYQQAVSEFSRRNIEPGSDAAEYAAHAAFRLADAEVQVFLRTKLSGSLKQLAKRQKVMVANANRLRTRLEQVWQYKRARWTLAAMSLSGKLFEHVGRAIAEGFRNAPLPAKVKRLGPEGVDLYLMQLDEALDREVRPIEDRAKELYRRVRRAREGIWSIECLHGGSKVSTLRVRSLELSAVKEAEDCRDRRRRRRSMSAIVVQRRPRRWMYLRVELLLCVGIGVAALGCGHSQTGTSAQTIEAEPLSDEARQHVMAASQEDVSSPVDRETVGSGAPLSAQTENAVRLLRAGRYEDAIREAKVALKRDEKHVPAMEVVARAYYYLGKLEFADAICELALEIQPDAGRCLNLRGMVALKQEDRAAALQRFEESTKRASDYGPGWLNLGAQYLEAKNYEAAREALEEAADHLPDHAEVYLNLGSAYRGAGQLLEAQQNYHRALKLRHNYAEAHFNLGILYLDAPEFPGLSKLAQLERAAVELNRYKALYRYRIKEDRQEIEDYLREVEKRVAREKKRMAREAARQARERKKEKQ